MGMKAIRVPKRMPAGFKRYPTLNEVRHFMKQVKKGPNISWVWTCRNCQYDEKATKEFCSQCGHPGPKALFEDPQWSERIKK